MSEEDLPQAQPAEADTNDTSTEPTEPQLDDPLLRHTAAKLDLEIGADDAAEQSEQRLRALRQAQQMPTDDAA